MLRDRRLFTRKKVAILQRKTSSNTHCGKSPKCTFWNNVRNQNHFHLKVIWRKLKDNKKKLVLVARVSVLVLNITEVDLAKNR